jgi:hypothetical protein
MPEDELGGLPYVSSAPDLIQEDEPHAQDEADYSTLAAVYYELQAQKRLYNSNDSLVLGDPILTLEQQLVVNKRMEMLIQGLQNRISNVIRKVRIKQDGRS